MGVRGGLVPPRLAPLLRAGPARESGRVLVYTPDFLCGNQLVFEGVVFWVLGEPFFTTFGGTEYCSFGVGVGVVFGDVPVSPVATIFLAGVTRGFFVHFSLRFGGAFCSVSLPCCGPGPPGNPEPVMECDIARGLDQHTE